MGSCCRSASSSCSPRSGAGCGTTPPALPTAPCPAGSREATAGRVYTCGSQTINGFPFRIEADCAAAGATDRSTQPPFAVSAKDVSVAAQVYRPTLLVGEISSPLTVAEPGQPPRFVANWSRAQGSVSGLPPEPDSVSVTLDHPHVDQIAAANGTTIFAADRAEFVGRTRRRLGRQQSGDRRAPDIRRGDDADAASAARRSGARRDRGRVPWFQGSHAKTVAAALPRDAGVGRQYAMQVERLGEENHGKSRATPAQTSICRDISGQARSRVRPLARLIAALFVLLGLEAASAGAADCSNLLGSKSRISLSPRRRSLRRKTMCRRLPCAGRARDRDSVDRPDAGRIHIGDVGEIDDQRARSVGAHRCLKREHGGHDQCSVEAKNALSRLRSGLVFDMQALLGHGGDINACVTLDC